MIGGHADSAPAAPPAVQTVAYRDAAGTVPAAPAEVAAAPHEFYVSLQTALRYADEQNLQIMLARKKVEEAEAAECGGGHLARLLHHNAAGGEEGAGPGGSRYAAEARTWQRRAELARTENETLLDAGNTYIDLLTARRGEAIGRELAKYQEDLLHRAEDLAKTDRSAAVLVESLQADVAGRRAAQAKLHQQGDAAALKLAYLLNLTPGTVVVPQDPSLEPMDLVDASMPAPALVERAQAEVPGVRELSGLLNTIEEGIASVRPCLARIPSVARQLETARYKAEETRLALEDTRAKLATGVLEAREAILSGRGQVADAAENIRHSAETYRLADLRLKQNAPGASTNEVSQSIRGLELAHFTHLSAVAAYDKAQLRLLLLLGRWDGHPVHP
jgi:outer membrane protein TolC